MFFPFNAAFAVIIIFVVYFFLITEKVNKVLVAILGASLLIVTQVFASPGVSSEESAFHFISKNLDILGFIIGMMLLVSIIRTSGVFEALAVWIVKTVRGNPRWLLVAMSCLTFVLTIFLSNVPTILIISPVMLVLIKQFNLPYFPYFFALITMANIAGSVTPISDPTTYYQAKTVGLGFMEVVMNSGLIALLVSVVVVLFTLFFFGKQLDKVTVNPEDVKLFKPLEAIKDKKVLKIGLPILVGAIILMSTKELISSASLALFQMFQIAPNLTEGIVLDNAVIALGAAFLCMFIFNIDVEKALKEDVDWGIIFFFMGLFVVVGSLEFTGVTELIAAKLVEITSGNMVLLLFLITVGSALISIFIDNVPYNITMVDTVLKMQQSGIDVYPLWWGLNLGTSIGGAGSLIGAACNVVAIGQVEQEGFHVKFMRYLQFGLPLATINALVAFVIIYLRYYI